MPVPMDIRVQALGPVEIIGADTGLGPKQRLLLGALAIRPGGLSTEEVAEILWGHEEAPEDPRATVQIHVSKLPPFRSTLTSRVEILTTRVVNKRYPLRSAPALGQPDSCRRWAPDSPANRTAEDAAPAGKVKGTSREPPRVGQLG